MRDLSGKVAFITGGVSGIGFSLAKAFAAAGMKVIVTYLHEDDRDAAMSYFAGHPQLAVHSLPLDVTDRAAVRAASEEAERVFGKVHLLCNNAGVNLLGEMDKATYDDWDWILGVNLNGVVNTLMSFVPKIKAHGAGGHIVNVASMSSFIPGSAAGIYTTSKFAVRGLSECLRYNLAPYRIGVSLVCPGLTKSRIYEAALKRPPSLANTGFPVTEAMLRRLQAVHASGMDPDEVARKTIAGVMANEFYIFPHSEFKEEIRADIEEILGAFGNDAPDEKRMAVEAARYRSRQAAQQVVDDLRKTL